MMHRQPQTEPVGAAHRETEDLVDDTVTRVVNVHVAHETLRGKAPKVAVHGDEVWNVRDDNVHVPGSSQATISASVGHKSRHRAPKRRQHCTHSV